MRIQKWLSALLAVCLLLTASACGGSNMEKKYVALIQQHLESGEEEEALQVLQEGLKNFPNSKILLSLQNAMENGEFLTVQDSTTEIPTEKAPSAVPTVQEVEAAFTQMRRLYQTWFTPGNIRYDRYTYKDVKLAGYQYGTLEETAFPVSEPDVPNKAALDALFLQHCSAQMYDSMPFLQTGYTSSVSIQYIDVDGKLYVVLSDVLFSVEDFDVQVKKLSDDDFEVRFFQVNTFPQEDLDYDLCDCFEATVHYVRTKDGYRFDNLSLRALTGEGIESGTYVVRTTASDLMVHSIPNDSKTSRIGSVFNGEKVLVIDSLPDWAYIELDDHTCGWVSSDYLVPYTDSASKSNSSAGANNNGDVVGDLIDGGLQIVDGVLGAIF